MNAFRKSICLTARDELCSSLPQAAYLHLLQVKCSVVMKSVKRITYSPASSTSNNLRFLSSLPCRPNTMLIQHSTGGEVRER